LLFSYSGTIAAAIFVGIKKMGGPIMKNLMLLFAIGLGNLAAATTYNVTGSSSLMSALGKARSGDVIVLASGKYGHVSINRYGYSSPVVLQSKSASSPAEFSELDLDGVDNIKLKDLRIRPTSSTTISMRVHSTNRVTLDGVSFVGIRQGGYGINTGIYVNTSSNFTMKNSKMQDFELSVRMYSNDSVDILDNQILATSHDGMIINKTNDLLIDGNVMTKNSKPDRHSDIIQFGNDGTKTGACSNVRVSNNDLTAADHISHGIYGGNKEGRAYGTSQYYRNFVIENNTLRTGQLSAIGIGETIGLTIRNNDVRSYYSGSQREIATPVIAAAVKASGVTITNNRTYKTPFAADANWQEVKTPGAWNVSNNTIIKP
jgi:hypothetical protein